MSQLGRDVGKLVPSLRAMAETWERVESRTIDPDDLDALLEDREFLRELELEDEEDEEEWMY